jgi:predicted SAM-dependent methyltransferase
MTVPFPQPLRLHLGGELLRPGWTIVNAQPAPGVDVVASITDLSMFRDASAAAIYASHVYEHLSNREVAAAFREAFRVLAPAGEIMIAVPDLEILTTMLAHPALSRADRWHVQRMIYGGQIDPFDFHKTGFTFDLLTAALEDAGFRHVTRVQDFNLFPDTSRATFAGLPISLNVRAGKPA